MILLRNAPRSRSRRITQLKMMMIIQQQLRRPTKLIRPRIKKIKTQQTRLMLITQMMMTLILMLTLIIPLQPRERKTQPLKTQIIKTRTHQAERNLLNL
jgi:DNA polymerase III psi subunit